ncbi:MAG: YdeI/OmpD-associated family protein, partial [Candidatus Nitrotoga sp.]
LCKEKRIHPAGIAQVTAAKNDGRWEQAYDSPKNMQMPTDFINAIKKNAKAYALFKTLNRANLYAICWRLQTAKKPETRKKRFDTLFAMLQSGKKLH